VKSYKFGKTEKAIIVPFVLTPWYIRACALVVLGTVLELYLLFAYNELWCKP